METQPEPLKIAVHIKYAVNPTVKNPEQDVAALERSMWQAAEAGGWEPRPGLLSEKGALLLPVKVRAENLDEAAAKAKAWAEQTADEVATVGVEIKQISVGTLSANVHW